MVKKSVFLVIVVLIIGLALPAYAAVQNVKLSGDVTIRGLYRNAYDLDDENDQDTSNGALYNLVGDSQEFFMSTVRLKVDADLTDNVAAEIELMNQRDWEGTYSGAQGSGMTSGTVVFGPGVGLTPAATVSNDQYQVNLNLANITIKEAFYAPLTIKMGRQNIQWGEGFVVGAGQLSNPDPANTISADEFSAFTSLDAIRAILDYDPWTIDMFAALLSENAINNADDVAFYGINVGREWGVYDAETELYLVAEHNSDTVNPNTGQPYWRSGQIYGIGGRGSIKPWDRLKLNGEAVYEFGKEGGAFLGANQALGRWQLDGVNQQQAIRAWAYNLRGEYLIKETAWPLTVGGGYVFYSGEENGENGASSHYRPLLRSQFFSAIREFQGQFYLPNVPATAGYTNEHQFMADVLFHPFNNEDITLFARFLKFYLAETVLRGNTDLGDEFDVKLSYDYTEDLTFSLISAVFIPGGYFNADTPINTGMGTSARDANDAASEVVGTVTLTF